MGAAMRRLLTFDCEGAVLGASLDEADGRTGVLIVTGGSQTRIGAHRSFERMAKGLAAAGYPAFRYDRRGVGDSEGEDPGFRGSEPDLRAAVQAFRAECPQLQRIAGYGLCDGATALALFGAAAGIDALLLANPWFVEAESGAPPPAAIKRHYRDRLLSVGGWKKLLGGGVSYRKLLKGLGKIVRSAPTGLATDVAKSLERKPLPLTLILAQGDATAIAAEAEWRSSAFRRVREATPAPVTIDTDAHTFAKTGDGEKLLAACLTALQRFEASGGF